VLTATAMALTLPACADDDDGVSKARRGPGGQVQVCELLTREEVATAVENPVADGSDEVGLRLCDWGASTANGTSVSVSLLVGPDEQLCVDALELDPANEKVDGFDVPTYWSYLDIQGGVGNVVACTREGQITLTVTGGLDGATGGPRLREAAEKLAARALERL
ncbi:MAG TPA: hypothetical protein VMQ81_00275, partial [Acidimicrobiia bacterium]|nr:hypothetical protein [Acidimicrobiia bacterium]